MSSMHSSEPIQRWCLTPNHRESRRQKILSGDDSERFILPDGEVLTREEMEAMLKTKAAFGSVL